MPSIPSYSRPPVREALIDIQIDWLPAEVLPELEQLQTQLLPKYPTKKTRYKWESTFELRPADFIAAPRAQGAFGYLFGSTDKKQIIQFRRDGFTFNQLKPDPNESWPGWEVVRTEAKRSWDMYVELTHPQEVTRLGVRYINQIVIRRDSIELNECLTAAPGIPKSLPQKFDSFFSRVEFTIPEANAKAIITQVPASPLFPNSVTIILDIDVLRQEHIPLNNQTIWTTLDQFRDLKNTIFEASLHQTTKDLFL